MQLIVNQSEQPFNFIVVHELKKLYVNKSEDPDNFDPNF